MKTTMSRFAAASILAFVASAALAAEKDNPLSARLGVFYPTSSDTRSATKSFGLDLGLSYKLKDLDMGAYNNASWGFDLDGIWIGSGDNKLEAYDLMLVGRWMNNTYRAGQTSLYYGLGGGLTRSKADTSTTTGSTTTNNSESKTSLVGKVLVGTMLSKQAFAELGLRLAPSVNGVNGNGFSLQVGVKF